MSDFTFDRSVQRYRASNGRFISNATMITLVETAASNAADDVLSIGNILVQGKVSLAEWQRATAIALKQMHIQQYLLGIGGEKMVTGSDRRRMSDRIQSELDYLAGFADDLLSGMSEAQFMARLQLYVEAGRSTYERARRAGHLTEGYHWERRRLGNAVHCDPCIGHSAKGWQDIGTLPHIGENCDCKSRCKCSFEFSLEEPQDKALSSVSDKTLDSLAGFTVQNFSRAIARF